MHNLYKKILVLILLIFFTGILIAEDLTVYITKAGTKYHLSTCSYLSSSKIPISLADALSQGYEPCKRCKPPTEVSPVSTPLVLSVPQSPSQEALAIPYCEDETQIHYYTGFALLYAEEHEQASWVAYLLTDDEVNGTIGRTDNFRSDKHIATGSASLSDYRGSGFDRGHLAPAGDMKWSKDAMSESFYMSNMSPQEPGFNRGIWKKLEEWVRDQAEFNEEIYVVTGPILTDGSYDKIGGNGVSVPNQYYKVILDYKEPEIKAIGFILPNAASKLPVSSFAVTVDYVENITGLDFFYLLDDSVEGLLESEVDIKVWKVLQKT